jgi:hypothetical protein
VCLLQHDGQDVAARGIGQRVEERVGPLALGHTYNHLVIRYQPGELGGGDLRRGCGGVAVHAMEFTRLAEARGGLLGVILVACINNRIRGLCTSVIVAARRPQRTRPVLTLLDGGSA